MSLGSRVLCNLKIGEGPLPCHALRDLSDTAHPGRQTVKNKRGHACKSDQQTPREGPSRPFLESSKASDWISSVLWWERTLRIDGLSVSCFQNNSESWGGANLQNVFTEVTDSMADHTGNNSCNDGCAPPPPYPRGPISIPGTIQGHLNMGIPAR